MIIKNSKSLITTLSVLIILPFVQKQWFNLYLFNNDFSFYSILYCFSGIICPSLIGINSLNSFTYYKFNKNIVNSKKIIKGKSLLLIVAINLLFLSYLIADYIYINLDLATNLLLEGSNLEQPDIFQLSIFILFIAILLLLKKSRIFLKKFVLVNFILFSFFNWYQEIINIKIDDKFHIYKFYSIDNNNLINVFYLIAIELFYLIWSFLSYKTNLSDWNVPFPCKSNIIQILKICVFYLFIIFYYSILS